MEQSTKKLLFLRQLVLTALLLTMIIIPVGAVEANQLQLELHHIVISEVDGVLEVREIINIRNNGEEAITVDESLPEEEQYTFQIFLPYSTNDVAFPEHIDMDKDIVGTETGFAYTMPIEPGETELDFFYTVEPHNGSQFLIDKEIMYPTKNLYIITRGDVGISGSKIQYVGSSDMGQEVVNQYYWEKPVVGENLIFIAGSGVAIESQSQASSGGQTNLDRGYRASFHSAGHIRFWYDAPFRGVEPHLFMVVFFGIVIAGTYFYIKARRHEDEDDEDEDDEKFQELLDKQAGLLAKLAQVEKRNKDGELTQEEYEKLYGTYKDKLVKIKMQLKLLSE